MVPYEYVRAALRSPVGGGMLTDRPAVRLCNDWSRLLPQLHRVACMSMMQALHCTRLWARVAWEAGGRAAGLARNLAPIG